MQLFLLFLSLCCVSGQLFGDSVSLSDDGLVALVGASGKDEGGLTEAGAAYIFTRASTSSLTWTQQQKLTAGDGTDLDADARFGSSVSLSGDGLVALVGADGKYESGKTDAGAAYIFTRSSSSSSTWTQQPNLLTAGGGADVEEDAWFGYSISLSGNGLVVLVGARYKNEGVFDNAAAININAGAAYIFSRPSTTSSTWTHQQKLTAGDGTDLEASAFFGHSVSLSGNGLVALVGASGKNEGGKGNAGAAYIFSRPSTSSSTWTHQQKLTAGNGTDLDYSFWFGSSVSLSSDGLVALVGTFHDEGSKHFTGAAYIFTRPSTSLSTWTQQHKLLAGTGTYFEHKSEYGAWFGSTVSLSGDGLIALVGAYTQDEGGLAEAGAAYIFTHPSTNSSFWTQQHKLLAGAGKDLEAGVWFGRSVSLSGDGLVALVGAPDEKDKGGKSGAGAAFIFTRPFTSSLLWAQQTELEPCDTKDNCKSCVTHACRWDGTCYLGGSKNVDATDAARCKIESECPVVLTAEQCDLLSSPAVALVSHASVVIYFIVTSVLVC